MSGKVEAGAVLVSRLSIREGTVGLKNYCQVARGRQTKTRTFVFCASVLDTSLAGSQEGNQAYKLSFTDVCRSLNI